jgi:hypothetical protein
MNDSAASGRGIWQRLVFKTRGKPRGLKLEWLWGAESPPQGLSKATSRMCSHINVNGPVKHREGARQKRKNTLEGATCFSFLWDI